MVLKSTKNLTQPETFCFKTGERTISKNRSDSTTQNMDKSEPRDKENIPIEIKLKENLHFMDFSIDDIIKEEERKEKEFLNRI
mmetsp:Transcript_30144/g.26710  ORF Transcript_30144/g.26710 Transcript_30144/m.26710 type:complete len:83 (+) Transcript_30144:215-463(+)